MCLMLLNDLSRSRSMVILMRRVLMGQGRITRKDLVRSRRETGENEYRLSLLKSFAVEENQEKE